MPAAQALQKRCQTRKVLVNLTGSFRQRLLFCSFISPPQPVNPTGCPFGGSERWQDILPDMGNIVGIIA
ncbi:MAG: hypothetical protein E6X17_02315 [Sporomusaceae bacterium]|nr:hypothetical protein [Sporomusaceae bacterium]